MNAPERFCNLCDISLDLHFGDKDCENAERRVQLLERFANLPAAVPLLPKEPTQ